MKQEVLIESKDLPYMWPEAAEIINKGLAHSNGEVNADSFFYPIYVGKQYLWEVMILMLKKQKLKPY